MDDGRLRELLLELLDEPLRRGGKTREDVDAQMNLVTGGILDSLEFVGLIAALEVEVGVQLDLSEMDPEEFATVEGLLKSLGRARAAR